MSKNEYNKLVTAMKESDIAYLKEKLNDSYLKTNSKVLHRLAWVAAENNYLDAEKFLKTEILQQLHAAELSHLSLMIAKGEPLPDLKNYSQYELLQALDIARFTKQSLEIRNDLKSELKQKGYHGKLQFNSDKAKIINERYLNNYNYQHSRRQMVMMIVAPLAMILIIPTAIVMVATGTALFMIPIIAFTIIAGGSFMYALQATQKPYEKCAENLVHFVQETNPEINVTNTMQKNDNDISIKNPFKITSEAKANIDKLEKISPGLIEDLHKHFSNRIAEIEHYLSILEKDSSSNRDPIVDKHALDSLKRNWDMLMESAAEGGQQFCKSVTSYLENFEEGQKDPVAHQEDPVAHQEDPKATLTFTNVDQKIKKHIDEIKAKLPQTPTGNRF